MNDKFLTGVGKYGIDFNQITSVRKGYKKGVFLILLFTKDEKYPVITLMCDKEEVSNRLYYNIRAVIEDNQTKGQVIKMSDFRKD